MPTLEAANEAGIRVTGHIGGQPKKRYWTPDGREIRSMPQMREYVKKDKKGKVIEQGVRDSNLDAGWLTEKPKKLLPYCPHCDKWHKTQKEITECGERRKRFVSRALKETKNKAAVGAAEPNERIDKLESDIAEIKGLLLKLAEK